MFSDETYVCGVRDSSPYARVEAARTEAGASRVRCRGMVWRPSDIGNDHDMTPGLSNSGQMGWLR